VRRAAVGVEADRCIAPARREDVVGCVVLGTVVGGVGTVVGGVVGTVVGGVVGTVVGTVVGVVGAVAGVVDVGVDFAFGGDVTGVVVGEVVPAGLPLRYASIMALAIGAARVPPWNSSAAGWSGRTTATAMEGLAAGAKAIIQSSVWGVVVPVWAVPVLAATSTPGMAAAVPVPSGELTTDSMSVVI
jgi:hypothetical protein